MVKAVRILMESFLFGFIINSYQLPIQNCTKQILLRTVYIKRCKHSTVIGIHQN